MQLRYHRAFHVIIDGCYGLCCPYMYMLAIKCMLSCEWVFADRVTHVYTRRREMAVLNYCASFNQFSAVGPDFFVLRSCICRAPEQLMSTCSVSLSRDLCTCRSLASFTDEPFSRLSLDTLRVASDRTRLGHTLSCIRKCTSKHFHIQSQSNLRLSPLLGVHPWRLYTHMALTRYIID